MNKVILMGRMVRDLELRYTQNGNAVCSFTIAVNRRMKKDETDFINCQAWNKTAEFINQYFQKGSMIAIIGRIQTRIWEDNGGKKHYVTEVVVEEVYFTGEKKFEKVEHGDAYEPSDFDEEELPF